MVAQNIFLAHMKKLTSVVQLMRNPFNEDSTDLLVFDTKDIGDRTIVIMARHEVRKEQFRTFTKGLHTNNGSTFDYPIKKNTTPFFKQDILPSSGLKTKALK